MSSPFSPLGAAPPTHDSKTWYSASWVEPGRPSRRAVSRATSHTPVSVRRPHSCTSLDSANAAARAATSGAIPRVSSGTQRRRDVVGVGEVGAGHGTVERDVVAERRRRLVGHGHAADVHQQRGVEASRTSSSPRSMPAGQRSGDQARAHRRARRQPEAEVGDHRKARRADRPVEPRRHGSTVEATENLSWPRVRGGVDSLDVRVGRR